LDLPVTKERVQGFINIGYEEIGFPKIQILGQGRASGLE